MTARQVKIASAALLLLSSALPLSSFAELSMQEGARRYRYVWQLLQEDSSIIFPLALVFLWPLPLLLLSQLTVGRTARILVLATEPVLAVISSTIVLALPQALLEIQQFFIWFIPLPSRVEAGGYAVIAVNCLYLFGWARELFGMARGCRGRRYHSPGAVSR
jgi:hypothetical protein